MQTINIYMLHLYGLGNFALHHFLNQHDSIISYKHGSIAGLLVGQCPGPAPGVLPLMYDQVGAV